MDLKHKFSGILNKWGSQTKLSLQSPVAEDVADSLGDLTYLTSDNKSETKESLVHSDLPSDEDILESVENDYFKEQGFDASRHELLKLSGPLNCDNLLRDGQKLQQQHKVISKKVLQLILMKQSACNEEFEKIQGLQRLLQEALSVCRNGRAHLSTGKEQLTTASLGILANYRKRQLILKLLHSLNTIKSLKTEERLQQLLSEGCYEGAMSLLLECQASASSFGRFTCVAALSGKLLDTLVMAEEQLDVALAKICEHFDGEVYGQLQAAYTQLGKTQAAMDQLHMHFTSAIQNTALKVVQQYASRTVGDGVTSGKQYNELCKSVKEESFIPCLQHLCNSLWAIVLSHHQVGRWHQRNAPDGNTPGAGNDLEASLNHEYIRQKLDSMQARVWQDIQSRFSTFLLASNLASFKYDNFLLILGLVHRLIEVGEEFCGNHSEELQKSIRQQSENYFSRYHAGCLEELRIFLENESWTRCPVKKDFSCLQLQEFRSLRNAIQSIHIHEQKHQVVKSPDSSSHSQDGSSVTGGYFTRYAESGSPFEDSACDLQEEDILANVTDDASGYFSDESDEDVPDELKGDFVDEGHGDSHSSDSTLAAVRFENCERVRFEHKKPQRSHKVRHREQLQGPLLTNTTLTVLRHCGKYLQMSRLLRTIAMDVIISFSQLFQYYMYAVHTFFTADLIVDSSSLYSIKLRTALNRINSDLIMPETDPNNLQQLNHDNKKIPKPFVSPIVNLNVAETLYGLSERVVAVESVIFLAEQLESLHPYLEHLVRHEPRKHYVQQFYLQTVSVASDLRLPVYASVAGRSIDLRSMMKMMGNVNWELKDVMSQHSQYVDFLLRELHIFSVRLDNIATQVFISKDVYNTLWQALMSISSNAFIDGFANAKKCSTGGRGLMQLDFTQFVSKLEKLTTLRPIPNKELVENYVKAYYLPEQQLEQWIRENTQYSSKHLITLVHCACQNNRKTRQRLSGIVEELERTGVIR